MKSTFLFFAILMASHVEASNSLPPPGPTPPSENNDTMDPPRATPVVPPRAIPIARPATATDPVSRMEVQTGLKIANSFREIVQGTPLSWRSSRTPWMDRRWRLDKGMIGDRYLNRSFQLQATFKDRYRYINQYPALSIAREISRRGGVVGAELSPSEKYDLLVGDSQGTLTQKMWQYSKSFDDTASITSWMAVCDGSAASTMAVPEPLKDVLLQSPDGIAIRFFPYDIKALATLFYSEISLKNIPIIGGRCNGKVDSKECRDPSPDIVHRILTQVSGKNDWPVMVDYTPGAPVWNAPIASYNIRYFNPETRVYSNALENATADLRKWQRDPFASRRSSRAVDVVGVMMTVELTPAANESVVRRAPELRSVNYQYELEIDAAGYLVGGQWETEVRPDFLWTVDLRTWPLTLAHGRLNPAELQNDTVPREWLPIVQQSSARGQPLVKVLKRLVELSK